MLLLVIDTHHLVDKHRMPVDIIQKSQFMMWISRKILLPREVKKRPLIDQPQDPEALKG